MNRDLEEAPAIEEPVDDDCSTHAAADCDPPEVRRDPAPRTEPDCLICTSPYPESAVPTVARPTFGSDAPPAPRPTDSSDRSAGGAGLGDKIAGFMQKLGQFLDKILPAEWAQQARGFMSQIGDFLSKNLKDIRIGRDGNGISLDLGREIEVKVPGTDQTLKVGPKVSFDLKPENGEVANIQGVKVKGPGGDVPLRGARVSRDQQGRMTLMASVGDREVPVPLFRRA